VPGLQDCDAWTEPLEFPYYQNLVCQAQWDVPLAWSPRMAGGAAAHLQRQETTIRARRRRTRAMR
jgi:hypothetical protein